MKAHDLDLDGLLRVAPLGRRRTLRGGRCLLEDAASAHRLVEELEDTVGARSARGLLTRHGYATGYQEATRLRRYYDWDDDREWLLAGGRARGVRGLGEVAFAELVTDRAQGIFRAVALATDSFEAEAFKNRRGPTEEPVCHRLAGYLSGYASAFLGDEVLFVERECAAHSDDARTCRFEGRLASEWGAAGKEHRRLYRRERLGELLAARDREVLEQAVRLREQEAQLEAKRKIEEASRLKSEFLANISHELRTPLNAIIGYTDLLLTKIGGKLPPKPRENLGRILANAEHLLELINDVLDLSKIEAGRVEVQPAAVDVGDLLDRCLADTRALIERSGKEVAVVADPSTVGLPPVWADEARLRQCLMNVLSNAAKFTERGEVRVSARRVSILREGEEQEALAVSVSDTGPGVPVEKQGLIFEPFRQADASASRPQEGTGLGLPIVKQLLALMGGEVRLTRSVPGQGSTFSLLVLLADAAGRSADDAAPAASADSAPTEDESAAGEVLVVDDDPDVASIVRELLADAPPPLAGLRVHVEGDPVAALAWARREPPAAVLLDLRLPNVDGREVLRMLREHPATAEVPVVVLSVREDRYATLEEGARAVLDKPLTASALLGALADALGLPPAESPPGTAEGEAR